jgi:hypothetical protein
MTEALARCTSRNRRRRHDRPRHHKPAVPAASRQVMPAADVAFGGGMLLVIIIIHATGVRVVTNYVAHHSHAILARPRSGGPTSSWRRRCSCCSRCISWKPIVWASSARLRRPPDELAAAGFFAGQHDTRRSATATSCCPQGWEMLPRRSSRCPGSSRSAGRAACLVDIVSRCQRIKDVVAGRAKS